MKGLTSSFTRDHRSHGIAARAMVVSKTNLDRSELLFCSILALFSLLAVAYSVQLSPGRDRVFKRSLIGSIKLGFTAMYALSSTCTLVILLFQVVTEDAGVAAMVHWICLSSWCVCIVSRVEHMKTVSPSHLLQFFLLLFVPLEVFWLQRIIVYDSVILRVSAYVHAALLGILVCVESCGKRHLLVSEVDRQCSAEETCGLFERRLFWYLNRLFVQAYRKNIALGDLEMIDDRLVSEDLVQRFKDRWSRRSNQSGRWALLRSLFAVLWGDMFVPILPRLLELATVLTQPFLISAILVHIRDPDRSFFASDYQMLGLFAANFLCSAIFSAWYSHSLARFTVKLRSVLISSIYDKALRSKNQEADLGSATVLMNVDLEKVLEGAKWIHEVWAASLGLAAGLYILSRNLGWIFVVPLIIILLVAALTWDIGEMMTSRNLDWVTKTEKRITTMVKIASSLKEVRLLGLTEVLHKTMTGLRVDELLAYRSTSSLWVYVVGTGVGMFPMLIFGTFTVVSLRSLRGVISLDYDGLFTSLSVLKLIAAMMLPMLQQIITFQGAVASFDRMQTYLVTEGKEHLEAVPEKETPPDVFQIEDPDAFELQENFPMTKRAKAFEITNANFGFHQARPLLHHINLTVEEASFTVIIGKVGSGKSLMLQALIGETTTLDGNVERSPSGISYCSQPPWLRNVSVRENILGETAFEENWYNTVIRACGLEQDFAELQKGDSTLTGSNGMAFSGGQKNRVSLARAVYSRKPVIIVDDILSGLDNVTQNLVFSRVFGREGLLRQMNCTVVLATHSVHWAAQSDKVVVMSEGSVVSDGHYDSLRQTSGLWEIYCLPDTETQLSEKNGPGNTQEVQDFEKKEVIGIVREAGLERQDDYKRQGESGMLLYYLKGVGKTRVAIYLALMTATYTANAVQFIWVKKLLSDGGSLVDLCRSISSFAGISLLAFFLTGAFMVYFFLILCPRSGLRLHARQLSVFIQAHFTSLVTKDVGDITNLFSQDTIIIDRLLPILWLNISTGVLEQTKNCIILTVATPPIAAIFPFLIAAGYVIQHFYLRTSRQLRHLDLEAKAPLCTNFLETLSGSATIRAFGWMGDFRSRNRQLLISSQAPYYLLQDTQNWLSLVLDLMVAGIISILVGLALFLRSKVDPGYLALALIGAMDLGFSIRIFVLAWTEVETAMSAVTRTRLFLENTGQEALTDSGFADPLWPTHGAVQFRNVCSSYTSNSSVPATLRNIDLKIAAGEKIGVCGRTGSGKSSLIATLLGLMHQTNGEILIDGISTATIPLNTLRTRTITLTQDPFFLDQSARDNLVPWAAPTGSGNYDTVGDKSQEWRPSDENMIRALQSCGVWEKLTAVAPDGRSGLDVSMGGVDNLLSEGEKQLFCLARAILHPGKVVLLDEATSRVDANTDALMQEILRTEFEARTIIAISHRLGAIMDFDRVVVMDNGKIAEIGSPKILKGSEGSLFQALVKVQG